MKIQRMKDLIAEMREVARGETPAPADAALPSVESAEALVRLLTPDNGGLLRVIRDSRPQSVAELARLTNRAESNLLRTLGKRFWSSRNAPRRSQACADTDGRDVSSRY